MELYLRYYENDEISISIYSINKIPSVKYELKSNLDEFQKNRFFKIFNNVEELMLELDSKIKNTTFLEETNLIILDIPIGLKIINDILLEIKLVEKNLKEENDELIESNNKLKLDIKNLENKINRILKQNDELNEENQKLKNEINNNNDNIKEFKLNLENLQIKLNNYENQKISLNKLITEKDFEQIYNKLDEEINLGNVINLDLFKIKIGELINNEKEKYEGVKKDDIINELKNKIVNIIL
jgi:chromosome segregation ATPase